MAPPSNAHDPFGATTRPKRFAAGKFRSRQRTAPWGRRLMRVATPMFREFSISSGECFQ